MIEKTFTVKAIDSATVATYDYTIAKAAPYNWATAKKSTQIAMEDNDYNAYIRIKDVNGDALSTAQASEYSVESSNNNVLIAAGTADGAIALTPVAQGTAYLVVSKDGKSVTSLPVTVVAKRVLTTVKIENSSVTVATSSAVATITPNIGNAVVTVKTLDQYGTAINAGTGVITPTSKPATAVGTEVTPTASAGKVVVSSTAAPAGTYGYKITFTDAYGNSKSGVFSVRVIAPGAVSSHKLAVIETDTAGTTGNGTTRSIDTTFSASNNADKNLHVYVVGVGSNDTIVSGSPLSAAVSVSAIKVTGSDGTVYAATGAGVTTVTSQAIDATSLNNALATNGTSNGKLDIKVRGGKAGNAIRKYLPAGVYTVTYTVKDSTGTSVVTKTYSTQFTVKDEQPTTTVKVVEPNIGSQTLTQAFANADNAVFYYDGIALKNASGASSVATTNIKAIIGATAANGTKATVQYVVAQIPVSVDTNGDGTAEAYTIDTVVPVNVTFTGLSGNLTVSGKSELKLYS